MNNSYWAEFKADFIANQKHKYVTIGNFSSSVKYEVNNDTLSNCSKFSNWAVAYYLIDNVIIKEYQEPRFEYTEQEKIQYSVKDSVQPLIIREEITPGRAT